MFGNEVKLATMHLQMDDANDTVLLRTVFDRVTDAVLNFKMIQVDDKQTENLAKSEFMERDGVIPSPYPGGDFVLSEIQVQFLFVDNFLNKFLQENPYREHLDLNFNDKIFFHEPVNKFFDLPLIRTFAWQNLMRVRHLQNPYKKSAKSQMEFENQVIGELTRIYQSQENELRRTSTEFEALMSRVMECVSGEHCTKSFREFISMNPNIEHVIKYIVSQ